MCVQGSSADLRLRLQRQGRAAAVAAAACGGLLAFKALPEVQQRRRVAIELEELERADELRRRAEAEALERERVATEVSCAEGCCNSPATSLRSVALLNGGYPV